MILQDAPSPAFSLNHNPAFDQGEELGGGPEDHDASLSPELMSGKQLALYALCLIVECAKSLVAHVGQLHA